MTYLIFLDKKKTFIFRFTEIENLDSVIIDMFQPSRSKFGDIPPSGKDSPSTGGCVPIPILSRILCFPDRH